MNFSLSRLISFLHLDVSDRVSDSIMNNILIDHISKSLTNVGLNILHSKGSYNIWRLVLIYMLFFTVEISIVMKSIVNYDNFNAFVTPAPYLATITISLGCIHIVYHYKKLIRELLYELDTNLFTNRDEYMIRAEEEKWYLRDDNIFVMIAVVRYGQYMFLVLVCVPILTELFLYRRIKTFIYPCWTPWRLNNLPREFFTFVLQVIQSSGGLWFNHVMIVLILIVVVEFVKQYRRLIAAILCLRLRTLVVVSQLKDDETRKSYDRVMRGNIICCIQHHQKLYK